METSDAPKPAEFRFNGRRYEPREARAGKELAMLRNRLTIILGFIALVLLLVGCGGGSSSKPSSSVAGAPDAARIHRGGTLIIAMDQNPVGDRFDPMKQGDTYTGYVTSAVTEGLIK